MPELKIYARGPAGLVTLQGAPSAMKPKALPVGEGSTAVGFTKLGDRYCVMSEKGIAIHDAATEAQLTSISLPRVLATAFSPKGKFLVVFQRPTADTKGEKNMSVIDIASGATVLHLYQKSFTKETWPLVQWSDDEAYAARMVNNEVHFYATADFAAGIAHRLRCQGVAALAMAPGSAGDPKFAVFVPEAKGAPGSVRLHSLSQLTAETPQPLARRSFFKCTEVSFKWNSTGTAVLVFASCDVDKTNQSYYGETNLHFLRADGTHEGNVPLGKEGPIHDMEWAPNGKSFVVVYGFMPAKATLFDDTCKPVYEFGCGPWNMVRWNPFSRFLCLCGFGNLPGDVEFFDQKADGKCKPMGACKMPCTVSLQWSPCGRHVLLATTAPRLRVDNGFKVLSYNGDVQFQQPVEVLYEAVWQPAVEDAYEDRPQTPGRAQGPGGAAKAVTPAAPTAYRPPSMRGQTGIPGSTPSFSAGVRDGAAGKYKAPGAGAGGSGVPGEDGAPAGETAAQKKNRKKREAAKKKKEEADAAGH